MRRPDAQITVQPVLDLAEHIHVGSYEASARLKLQTQLRDGTCVFAFCFRPAEKCDCEHRVPHEDGGPTCSCNQAPCCRRHHRAKTTGGWTYVTVEPGVYLWRSPLGYQYLKDHTAPLTSPPTPNDSASPATSSATSANPDHPAPHPAHDHSSGEFGALSAATQLCAPRIRPLKVCPTLAALMTVLDPASSAEMHARHQRLVAVLHALRPSCGDRPRPTAHRHATALQQPAAEDGPASATMRATRRAAHSRKVRGSGSRAGPRAERRRGARPSPRPRSNDGLAR